MVHSQGEKLEGLSCVLRKVAVRYGCAGFLILYSDILFGSCLT
jgi:hypothetical protein